MWRCFKYQSQRDLATLCHQNVICATGGLIVHAFHAYAARRQRGSQAWMDEALARAGAEDDDIRCNRIDLLEMFGRQRIEGCYRPGRGSDFRQNYQAVVERKQIDLDPILIVRGDSLVLLGTGGVKLHEGVGWSKSAARRCNSDI
jgi:hypothetical protein